MDITTLVFLALGLVLLVAGAELLVKGASGLAISAGISPLVVGLTVVAFGTSAPELAVSASAGLRGQGDIALGNVVGSNIANVLLILGVSALVAPLVVSRQLVRLDVPIMIGASVLLLLVGLDGVVSRVDGVLLVAGIVAYTTAMIRIGRRDAAATAAQARAAALADGEELIPEPARGWVAQVALVLAGLALLVLGSRWLVNGAVAIATLLGVSQLVIGLTVVAVGTSLPEIATSILATLRGARDLAVGNVVGSNIYNILAILGISAAIAPDGIPVAPAALGFDVPVMIAVAVACLPVAFNGYMIARWEGALFLGYYLAYTLYVILAATEHDALPYFSGAMMLFVIPLTVVTLAVVTYRAFVRQRSASAA
ncbi:MAG: Inner membrane protein YrbG, predicted calcium/sodium:proton antiporter [uncultured Gemmatimonadetes bacterium]|uniref:Inner membrane protein YrbG, predicted calcium/sodium:proton antiporter n=1 Tax=uncultured Gemmatimonadota bacterium TaxID=203437 RepID=A0A6J4N329_9BACT|nr:MAG: Inner membrane protein YrbG, predicted calcium/sodium:proton antiporter [uncultured Gemmatimonadota bacterium]